MTFKPQIMSHLTLITYGLLTAFLAFSHMAVAHQAFPMHSFGEKERQSHFVKHPMSVLEVPSKILSSAVSVSALDCSFSCVETESCLSFNFGIHSKLCQLLSTDKYESSDKFQGSEEFHHYSIKSPCASACKGGSCQPIYASDDFVCKFTEYHLAARAQNCDSLCASLGLKCVQTGGFPTGNAAEIFKSIGYECSSTTRYYYPDNPCFRPSNSICHGATQIPNVIDCQDGHNADIRRLCPCK